VLQTVDVPSTLAIGAALVAVALLVWSNCRFCHPLPKESATSRASHAEPAGGGDHDQRFEFGRRPSALHPTPFTTAQYARLLLLRSRWQAGLVSGDGDAACSVGISRSAREQSGCLP
jgi:hypothetical protein